MSTGIACETSRRACAFTAIWLLLCGVPFCTQATELSIQGQVVDAERSPVSHALVTVRQPDSAAGADATTVFSDVAGRFAFPGSFTGDARDLSVSASALNYVQVSPASGNPFAAGLAAQSEPGVIELTIVMRHESDQALTAPASAWLDAMPNNDAKARLLVECVNCHQFPTPEVRTFIDSLATTGGAASDVIQRQAWHAKIDQMSAIFAEALARGMPENPQDIPPAAPADMGFFHPQDVADIVALLSRDPAGGTKAPQGYGYGAPLAVTVDTSIREYEVPGPNAIREAISLGTPAQLYVADFLGDRLVRIDVASGAQETIPVPFDRASGPHTLVRGADDSLWLSGVFNGFVGHLDPQTEQWQVWHLQAQPTVSAHDLTYDYRNDLAVDTRGRIWYSDIGNNALGSFDPATGTESSVPAAVTPGRGPGDMSMYGIVMASDRQHVCYAQLGGDFGCFNTETQQFESHEKFPVGAGPRRMAITEDDVIYIPLFGAGQLVEYDARAYRRVAEYDLPDRASGPYAATWDMKRRVVWIATSNADVIYRFDPATKSFGVIPLPRQKAYLRMLQVDPGSGDLVTSYANLPGNAAGPRMAVLIDPGD